MNKNEANNIGELEMKIENGKLDEKFRAQEQLYDNFKGLIYDFMMKLCPNMSCNEIHDASGRVIDVCSALIASFLHSKFNNEPRKEIIKNSEDLLKLFNKNTIIYIERCIEIDKENKNKMN
jgi:hypothetical protein